MALFNFLKKSNKQPVPPKPKRDEQIAKNKKIGAKYSSKKGGATSSKRKLGETANVGSKLKESKLAWRVLIKPHVTEKSTDLTSENKYIFKILSNTTKPEVKHAVEDLYGVSVIGVNRISVPKKKRKRGKHIGWKPGYTKAIVTLKEGDKIEVLPH